MSDPVRRSAELEKLVGLTVAKLYSECRHEQIRLIIGDALDQLNATHLRVVEEKDKALYEAQQQVCHYSDLHDEAKRDHDALTQQLADKDNAIVLLGEIIRELTLTKAALTNKLEAAEKVIEATIEMGSDTSDHGDLNRLVELARTYKHVYDQKEGG